MAIIYTYPVKTTPVDADLVLISDSADSNNTKQVTISSIKGLTAGVTSIIAGNNVNITSTGASGTGDVTINASGGGTFSVQDSGGTAIAGIDTLNFNSNLSLIHAPGSSTITINASSGSSVDTFTNAFGTYITGTANSTATGAITMGTIDLSAIDGTSDTTTKFLSKDNTWDVPSYTTDVMGSGNSYANGLVLAGNATHNDEFLRKDGTWQTAGGAITSYTNAGSNRILTSSGTGVINGESSLLYNGSILTLGTNSTLEGYRFNADNAQTTNGIIELSNTSTVAYAYQANLDSNSKTTGANRHIIFRYDGSEIGYIRNLNSNTVEYSTSASDERKKKNIVDWNDKILDSFSLIEPKKFNYLNENDSDELTKGFIAQKMVDKFPEAYPKDPDTENELGYYSFNPSGMTIYLMKAVKELKEEIDTLKSRISTLEG
jgi:hypothetical protein